MLISSNNLEYIDSYMYTNDVMTDLDKVQLLKMITLWIKTHEGIICTAMP